MQKTGCLLPFFKANVPVQLQIYSSAEASMLSQSLLPADAERPPLMIFQRFAKHSAVLPDIPHNVP